MEKKFRVTGNMAEGPVIWFVNRSTETEYYALDESFSQEEATCLARLLKNRNLECRIEEIPDCAVAAQSDSWNLIGRLFELVRRDRDQLSFPVIGCIML